MKYVGKKVEDIKIAYIGGGSRGWAWGLMSDLAKADDICGTVALYDIDKAAAKNNEIIGNRIKDVEGCKSFTTTYFFSKFSAESSLTLTSPFSEDKTTLPKSKLQFHKMHTESEPASKSVIAFSITTSNSEICHREENSSLILLDLTRK